MLRNLFVQFLRDARAQRLRLALTIGGLAWGTAAVVLLLAFGEGFGRQQLVRQQGLGESIVINWPMRTTLPWQGLPRGRTIAMTPEDLTWLRRELPEIARLSEEFQRGRARIAWQDRSLAVNLTATNVEYGAMRNLVPSAGGRFLNEVDLAERRRVVFLGDAIAAELFGNESEVVGRTVRIDGVPFLVIGVMAKKLQDSSYNGRDENRATIPSTTFRALYGVDEVDFFIYQTASPADVPVARRRVQEAVAHRLRFDPDDMEAIQVWDLTEMEKFLGSFSLAFQIFLLSVGSMTLVVGGIGVANIMYLTVEERTREIGIKMALGARPRFVLGQFLCETLLLTGIGGAVGFLFSWTVCAVFPANGFAEYLGTPSISWPVASFTAAILGGVGLVAGFFPARAAARLAPVEALRS